MGEEAPVSFVVTEMPKGSEPPASGLEIGGNAVRYSLKAGQGSGFPLAGKVLSMPTNALAALSVPYRNEREVQGKG